MIYAILLILIVLLDQATKILISSHMPLNTGIELIPGEWGFSIHHVKNDGAAFSFLGDTDWGQKFFFVLTIIILPILFIVFLRLKNDKKWLKTTVIFIIGGTIGNFIDRVVFGMVTDFLWPHWFANFNVADIFLTVGAIMLIFWFLFLDDEAIIKIGKKKKKEADTNG